MSFAMAGMFDRKPGSDTRLGLLSSPTLLLLWPKIGQLFNLKLMESSPFKHFENMCVRVENFHMFFKY